MTLSTELVSIISPAYNSSRTIDATIRSVLAQTHHQWEMLIADDGSSDDTVAKVQAYCDDPRIRLIRNEHNMGPARTRNRLLQEAKGRYIAFLDTDDEWLPGKLDAQLELLQKTGAGICCSGYTRRMTDKSVNLIPPPVIRYEDLLRTNHIPMLTALIDRNRHPRPEFAIKGHEDYQLWLDLTRDGDEVQCVQKILAVYNAGSLQSVSGNKLKAARWHWNIMSREPLPLYKKIFFFCIYMVKGFRKNI